MSNESETKAAPKRGRRFLRFSLRGLLVVVAICSVWLGIAFHRAREQARAVGLIESRTGYVFYNYNDVRSGFVDEHATSPVPTWLLENFGEDFFHNVTLVDANDVTDEDLETICDLTKIRRLFLDKSTVTNAGMTELRRLSELRVLCIESPCIDDRGLAVLEALGRLEYIEIASANISDDGLVHFKMLPRLKELLLSGTRVTPSGAEELQEFLPTCDIHVQN